MPDKRKPIPPYLQRGLLVLIIFLMGVSVARLLVSMHQQQERIEILEAQVLQLMSDTSRLQIPAATTRYYSSERSNYHHSNNSFNNNRYNRTQHQNNRTEHINHTSNVNQQGNNTTTSDSTNLFVSAPRQEAGTSRKFTEVHQFDLNTIDSVTLIRIPGIAGRTASTILKNRQRYGGFYDPWQLQDFLTWDAAQAYMEEWCTQWFTADGNRLHHLPINSASISELQRHPYISHEQAIEISRYRNRHKRFNSAMELQQLSSFSSQQIQQVLPYLSFE